MRVLVIGGAGYIGSHAVRKLIEEGNDVVVLDSLYTGHRKAVDKKAKFYQGDIEDTNLVSKILRDENIDAVMHFAAYSLVPESVKKPLKYYDNNVSGMISLLQAMDDAKVKYLVFSSSAATYGIPKTLPITEDTPLDPINPYGETKMMMEKIMHWADKADGIKSIALRYFNVAGASSDGSIGEDHGPETHLIPNILKSAISGDGNKVTAVKYKDKETGEEKEVKVAGVFIYVGIQPQTAVFKDLGITDEQGWILTDNNMRTKVKGIFALGDVRAKELRQIATAVGEGSIAGQEVYNYYQGLNEK